jgi:hypothetical protein
MAVNSVAIMVQKLDYVQLDEPHQTAVDNYCVFAGFFEYYTSLVELFMILFVIHGLYQNVIKQKPKKYLEVIYLCVATLVPLVIACVPFFGITYGKSGPWCWIKDRTEDCERNDFGTALQFVLWYLPLIIAMILTLIASIFTCYKVRKGIENHWQGPYDPELSVHRGRLRKVFKIMLTYMPVCYLLINLCGLPNALYWAFATEPWYPLWLISGLCPPLRGAFFAIPYLFHTETRRQIKKINISAAIKQKLFKKHKITAYPAKECAFSDSLTFPAAADTTVERLKIYRNPSLRQTLSQSLEGTYKIDDSHNTTTTTASKEVDLPSIKIPSNIENGPANDTS